MSERLRVLIHGRVQGVGFRYSTSCKAQGLGLTSWVRNLYTGSVEALFEGPRNTLEEMLSWCKHGPMTAKVKETEVTWERATAEHSSFEVRAGA
jgi:acylphosphatase